MQLDGEFGLEGFSAERAWQVFSDPATIGSAIPGCTVIAPRPETAGDPWAAIEGDERAWRALGTTATPPAGPAVDEPSPVNDDVDAALAAAMIGGPTAGAVDAGTNQPAVGASTADPTLGDDTATDPTFGPRPAWSFEEGETYLARIQAGTGNVVIRFDSEIAILEHTFPRMRAVVEATGGNSVFSMETVMTFGEDPDGVTVGWRSDFDMAGRLAQLNGSMLALVSETMVDRFFADVERCVGAAGA